MTEKTMNEGRLAEIRYYAENDPDSYVRQVLRDLLAELSRLRAVLTQQEEELTRIRENAESWHGLGEDGPRKALAVIAGWCSDALTGVRSDG